MKKLLAEQNKKEQKIYGNLFARLQKMEEKELAAAPATPGPTTEGDAEMKVREGVCVCSEGTPVMQTRRVTHEQVTNALQSSVFLRKTEI